MLAGANVQVQRLLDGQSNKNRISKSIYAQPSFAYKVAETLRAAHLQEIEMVVVAKRVVGAIALQPKLDNINDYFGSTHHRSVTLTACSFNNQEAWARAGPICMRCSSRPDY